jgi:hypothetical protein
MALHLGNDRRRFPRATMPLPPHRIECATVMLSLAIGTAARSAVEAIGRSGDGEHTTPAAIAAPAAAAAVPPARRSPFEQAMSGLATIRNCFDSPLVVSGLAGLGLAVCGGVTFVAVRRAIGGTPSASRSGDAVAT